MRRFGIAYISEGISELPVLGLARGYGEWVGGSDSDYVDALLQDLDLKAVAPWLSAGEHRYAARRQRRVQRSEKLGRWVQTAVQRMGGEAALRGLATLKLESIGYRNLLEQSERPEGPWIPQIERVMEMWVTVNGRWSETTDCERKTR